MRVLAINLFLQRVGHAPITNGPDLQHRIEDCITRMLHILDWVKTNDPKEFREGFPLLKNQFTEGQESQPTKGQKSHYVYDENKVILTSEVGSCNLEGP